MQSAMCRAWEKKLRVVEVACRGSCVSYKKQSVSYNKQSAVCRGRRRSNMPQRGSVWGPERVTCDTVGSFC